MKIYENLTLMERIDRLTRLKATGTPKELANRLDISERSLYNLIKQMKSLGAPIEYNKARNSYQYTTPVTFKFGFFGKEGDKKNIYGGNGVFLGKNFDFFSSLQIFCSEGE